MKSNNFNISRPINQNQWSLIINEFGMDRKTIAFNNYPDESDNSVFISTNSIYSSKLKYSDMKWGGLFGI